MIVSARNKSETNFFKLPPELRLKIFKYAALGLDGKIITVLVEGKRNHELVKSPLMSGICRDLHSELLETYHSTHTFLLEAYDTAIMPSRNMMSKSTVHFGECWAVQHAQCGSSPRGWRFGTKELMRSEYVVVLPAFDLRRFIRSVEMWIPVPLRVDERSVRLYARPDTVIHSYDNPSNDWLMPVKELWKTLGFYRVARLSVWLMYNLGSGMFGEEEDRLVEWVRGELLPIPEVKALLAARKTRVFCGHNFLQLWPVE